MIKSIQICRKVLKSMSHLIGSISYGVEKIGTFLFGEEVAHVAYRLPKVTCAPITPPK